MLVAFLISNRTTRDIYRTMSKKRPAGGENDKLPKRAASGWMMSLISAIQDPRLHIYSDSQVVVIRDKFPKSRHHYLMLPRCAIDTLTDLTSAHIPLVEHMIEQGKQFTAGHITPRTRNSVRCGFHMIPSVKQLHMHIISQDFDSECLKHKKHWNSFASEFFMEADTVLGMLKGEEKILVDKNRGEQLLKLDLKCHVCHVKLPTIPKLKDHIRTHDKDRGADGKLQEKKIEILTLDTERVA
ncbi:aprataxin-like [Paramacrobiotus metropolitanus]|uniref:aprataxin-like n=1 Tax=Paramacrobiotus metropolitanus TaxID=2943436 RepID=UPI002445EB9A|nr:aprataxin-like [Paramacrobiotus metropolitanus]